MDMKILQILLMKFLNIVINAHQYQKIYGMNLKIINGILLIKVIV